MISKYNSLNNLQRKYNCDYSELLALYNESVKELSEMEFSDEDLKKINDEKNALLHQVTDKAKKISSHRQKTAEIFIKKVTEELRFLDMPNVILDVKHDIGKLTINGMDSIESVSYTHLSAVILILKCRHLQMLKTMMDTIILKILLDRH